MPALTTRVLSYRLHRPSGQALVCLNGKYIYLGRWNRPHSAAEHLFHIQQREAVWLALMLRQDEPRVNKYRDGYELSSALPSFATLQSWPRLRFVGVMTWAGLREILGNRRRWMASMERRVNGQVQPFRYKDHVTVITMIESSHVGTVHAGGVPTAQRARWERSLSD